MINVHNWEHIHRTQARILRNDRRPRETYSTGCAMFQRQEILVIEWTNKGGCRHVTRTETQLRKRLSLLQQKE